MSDWTPEKVAKLEKLWAAGISITQISKRISMTRNATHKKAARLGLPGRQGQTHRAEDRRRGPIATVAPTAPYDPNRADKLLRRFSWEVAA